MGLFGGKKEEDASRVLGIDVGVHGIKMVELQAHSGRASLSTYGFTEGFLGIEKKEIEQAAKAVKEEGGGKDMEIERERLAAVLVALREKIGAKSKAAVASIPITSVFSAVMSIPKTDDPAQRDALVRQQAQKLLPVPIEDVVLDHSVLENLFEDEQAGKKTQEKVILSAAPKTLVAHYTEMFKLAGLTLKSLESESFALVHALMGNDPGAAIILDIGASRSNLYLVRSRVPVLHRSINIGGSKFTTVLVEQLGVSEGEAEQIKRDMAAKKDGGELLEAFRPVADPIVQEIKYHMQLFEKQLGSVASRPEKIILTGGSALLPHLDSYLEQYFQMRVYVGDPWARVIYPEPLRMALDQIGPRFAIAIGLALGDLLPYKKLQEPQKK